MADEQVSIRPAEPADAKELLQLLRQLNTESATFSADDNEQLTVADEQHEIAAINSTKTNLLMVAALGPKLLGLATVQPVNSAASIGEVGVAVLKAEWGQGLGTALVEETLRWASDYSVLTQLVLTVQVRNKRAIKLYDRLGFVCSTQKTELVTDTTGSEVAAFEMQFNLSH